MHKHHMNKKQIEELAKELFEKYELVDWKLRFRKAKTYIGQCAYHNKTITISTIYAPAMTVPQITNTLLHEIAHALVSPGHGHDRVWQEKAIEIGAVPKAKTRLSTDPNYDLSRSFNEEVLTWFNGRSTRKSNTMEIRAFAIADRITEQMGGLKSSKNTITANNVLAIYKDFQNELRGTCKEEKIQLLFRKWLKQRL